MPNLRRWLAEVVDPDGARERIRYRALIDELVGVNALVGYEFPTISVVVAWILRTENQPLHQLVVGLREQDAPPELLERLERSLDELGRRDHER